MTGAGRHSPEPKPAMKNPPKLCFSGSPRIDARNPRRPHRVRPIMPIFVEMPATTAHGQAGGWRAKTIIRAAPDATGPLYAEEVDVADQVLMTQYLRYCVGGHPIRRLPYDHKTTRIIREYINLHFIDDTKSFAKAAGTCDSLLLRFYPSRISRFFCRYSSRLISPRA